MNIKKTLIPLLFFLLTPFYLQANIIYVNHQAEGLNNGSTWADAYTDLQDALMTAIPEDEIWVAQGTYRPTDSTDRTIEFEVTNSVEVYGGFIGNEINKEERNWVGNTTILSGDIGVAGDSLDNSFTVVFMDSVDSTTVLDGFTITEGQADIGGSGGSTNGTNSGGGLFLYTFGGDVDPLIQNCVIVNNVAVKNGGGVMVYTGLSSIGASKAVFNQCSFINNKTIISGGGTIGCALRITKGDFIIKNCIFKDILEEGQIIVMNSLDSNPNYAIKFISNIIQNCSAGSSVGGFNFTIINELNLIGRLVIDSLLVDNVAVENNSLFFISNCKTVEFTNSEIKNSSGESSIIHINYILDLSDTSKVIINNNSFSAVDFPGLLTGSGTLDIKIKDNIFKNQIFTPTNFIPTSYIFYYEYNNIANFLDYKINIKNNVFYNNTGKVGHFDYTDLTFENNTIVQQSPIDNLFYLGDSTNILSFKNNIFDNINLPDSLAYFELGEEVSMNVENNLFSRPNCETLSDSPNFNCEDNNLFSQSSFFTDTLNGDFTLLPCSPGVNQGQNVPAADSLDFYQNTRIEDGIIDIGAAETFPVSLDSFSIAATACTAFSNGTIEAFLDNACLPLTYLWEDEAGSGQGNTGLAAGNYDFTVTDARGSSLQLNLEIESTAVLAAELSTQAVSCETGVLGSATVSPLNGNAPYTIEWETEGTGTSINELFPDTYSLTITDAQDCILVDSLLIETDGFLAGAVETDSITCFGLSDGAAAVVLTGGFSPIEYFWEETGETSSQIDGLGTGQYQVQVNDSLGCAGDFSFDILEPQELSVSSTIVNATNSMATDGSIFINQITGGTAPYILTWENETDVLFYQNIPADSYPLSLTDSKGCTLDTSFVVSYNTSLQESEKEQIIFVFPNPTENYLTISSQRNIGFIQIIDVRGRLISQISNQENTEEWSIFIGDLVSGVYFLTFWDEDKTLIGERTKVIKI